MKANVIFGWQEKAPYEAKAAKRKQEYEKLMNAYNKKEVKYSFCIFTLFFPVANINPICRIAPVVRVTKGLRLSMMMRKVYRYDYQSC